MATATLTPSPVRAPAKPVYAIEVVRVSQVGKREGEKFRSPTEQKTRMAPLLQAEGLELAEVIEEMDISGRRTLPKRRGLTRAIELIEAGHAQVLVVAYFDRLCRNVHVKSEVVQRVEAAGGRVLAVDFGEITEKTAAQWLSSTLMAAVAEYVSRQTGERLGGTQALSIAAGVPIGAIPPGYYKDPETRRVKVNEAEAEVMRGAFELRAGGASYNVVRRHMAKGGIVRGHGSVVKLLHSRTYLGELFHGKKRNPESHQPIIDKATWDLAQRRGESFKPVPGRKSEQLMSGLRLLKCGTCGKSLATGAQVQGGKHYPVYRCNPNLICSKRVNIDARIVDEAVATYVRALLVEESTTAGVGLELVQAQAAAEQAQANYDKVQRNLALSADEAATQQILADYKAQRDEAAAYAGELERRARSLRGAKTYNAAADWNRLSFEARRELISAVLDRVDVAPGGRHFRGASRLSFKVREVLS